MSIEEVRARETQRKRQKRIKKENTIDIPEKKNERKKKICGSKITFK